MNTRPSLPFHLSHKPLVAVSYADFDGPYASDTDALYISLGLAQWEDHYAPSPAISAKIWRHSDTRWSRQSEEMPLHRPIDLTILIAAALKQASSGHVCMPEGTFEGQATTLDLPVYGSFHLTKDASDLVRRRLIALVRTIAIQHPDIVEQAGLTRPGNP